MYVVYVGRAIETADAAFRGTDTRPEPDAQIAVGLIAQPQSGEFDPVARPLRLPALQIAWSCDTPALERARREADITRQLAAIVEVTMEYLANEQPSQTPDRSPSVYGEFGFSLR